MLLGGISHTHNLRKALDLVPPFSIFQLYHATLKAGRSREGLGMRLSGACAVAVDERQHCINNTMEKNFNGCGRSGIAAPTALAKHAIYL
jgi:hypothetical protein